MYHRPMTDTTGKGMGSALGWARIVAAVGIAALLALVGRSALRRHDEEVTRREAVRHKQRVAAQRASDRQVMVANLVRDYAALQTRQWPRRDRMLELIEGQTDDAALKAWAAGQRKKIAPMLSWLASKQQLLLDPQRPQRPQRPKLPPSPGKLPPPGTPAADAPPRPGADQAAEEKRLDTPAWKTYAKTRTKLRRQRGKLCCKITTGRILFSRADAMGGCRRSAARLCNALAKAAGARQRCNYTLAQECASGAIIGGGDVTGEP
jgi:hypothetical protein